MVKTHRSSINVQQQEIWPRKNDYDQTTDNLHKLKKAEKKYSKDHRIHLLAGTWMLELKFLCFLSETMFFFLLHFLITRSRTQFRLNFIFFKKKCVHRSVEIDYIISLMLVWKWKQSHFKLSSALLDRNSTIVLKLMSWFLRALCTEL